MIGSKTFATHCVYAGTLTALANDVVFIGMGDQAQADLEKGTWKLNRRAFRKNDAEVQKTLSLGRVCFVEGSMVMGSQTLVPTAKTCLMRPSVWPGSEVRCPQTVGRPRRRRVERVPRPSGFSIERQSGSSRV